jgi:hypothetical protein
MVGTSRRPYVHDMYASSKWILVDYMDFKKVIEAIYSKTLMMQECGRRVQVLTISLSELVENKESVNDFTTHDLMSTRNGHVTRPRSTSLQEALEGIE